MRWKPAAVSIVFVAVVFAYPSFLSAEVEMPGRDIASYIKEFLESDHQLAISRLALRSGEIEERRFGDRSDSRLTYSPAYTYTRDRGLGGSGSLDHRTASQSLGYSHTTGRGTGFGASAGYDNDNSTLYGSPQDTYSGELSVSQPLLRNRFGELWKLERGSKGLGRESSEHSLRNTRLSRHLFAAGIYVRAYVSQRKSSVFLELLENMKKVWEQTQKDFQTKHLTKLNYLSVKSNWFEMLDTKERIETGSQRSLRILNFYAAGAWEDLVSPEAYFAANPVPEKPDFSSHPSVLVLDKRAAAIELEARVIGHNGRPDLSLDGSAGYTHTGNAFSYSGRDRDEWIAKTGFKLAFPVFDPKTKYDLEANAVRAASLRRERAEVIRGLEESWAIRLREYREAGERSRLNSEKLDVYDLQVQEAYRKFRQGRMEFQDYLQHWERYENAQLSGLDLRQSLWAAHLELLGAAGKQPGLTAEPR